MAKVDVVQVLRDAEKATVSELNAIRAAIKVMAGSGGTFVSAGRSAGRKAGNGISAEGRAPRRRRMSAAARKAVSERMRKYWAARRARSK